MDQIYTQFELDTDETLNSLDFELECPKLVEQTSLDILRQSPDVVTSTFTHKSLALWISNCDIRSMRTPTFMASGKWCASWPIPQQSLKQFAEENLLTTLGVLVIVS
jgi:hypothetical protein